MAKSIAAAGFRVDTAGTGAEAGNPPSTDVVSLSFRRGFDQILVTTRLRSVPGYPQEWRRRGDINQCLRQILPEPTYSSRSRIYHG